MKTKLKYAAETTSRKVTDEGFLEVGANVFRSGIHQFGAWEFSIEKLPEAMKTINPETTLSVLVPPDSISDSDFLKSLNSSIVTDGHPFEMISARNARFYSRGVVKEKAKVNKNGIVAASLLITDSELINEIMNEGKEQVSLGNFADIDWTPGNDPNLGPYDGVMSSIKNNHTAIVYAGRLGENVRLMNKGPDDGKPKKGKRTMQRIINGVPVEIHDDDVQVFDTVIEENKKLKTQIETLNATIENGKKDLDKVTAELDAEKLKSNDAEKIDSLVEARVSVINEATRLFPEVDKTKSNREIKVQVLNELGKVREGVNIGEKSDEYVDALFDAISSEESESTRAAKLVNRSFGQPRNNVSKLQNAREEREKNRREKHKSFVGTK